MSRLVVGTSDRYLTVSLNNSRSMIKAGDAIQLALGLASAWVQLRKSEESVDFDIATDKGDLKVEKLVRPELAEFVVALSRNIGKVSETVLGNSARPPEADEVLHYLEKGANGIEDVESNRRSNPTSDQLPLATVSHKILKEALESVYLLLKTYWNRN